MELGLKNKNVLVVGGSKGIGRGIVEGFAAEGCKIVAIARSKTLLQEVKSASMNLGAASFDLETCDVMECDTKSLAQHLIDTYGIFDIVIHNVGGSLVSRNHLGPSEDWSYPLYASSKAFLNAYITTVGRQLAPTGVTLCSVMPGAVTFPGSYWDKYIKEGNPRVEDFLRHHQAVDRFGTPEEIANMVLFMASDKASFMQAANIPVDGANM